MYIRDSGTERLSEITNSLNLQFNENVNFILGKNAQGKTNLLREHIYVTSMGKSFRTN